MEELKNLLIVHPSGRLIKPSKNVKFPIFPHELNGYNVDETLRKELSKQVYSRNMLPMVVHSSPLLCYIINQEWMDAYTDSIKTSSLLQNIINCYGYPGYEWYDNNKEQIQNAHATYGKDAIKMEKRVFDIIKHIKVQFDTKKINEKEALTKFIETMQRATIDYINLLERRVMMMFGIDMPLLTPMLAPTFDKLKKEDQQKTPEFFCHFYQTKELLRNVFDNTENVKWFDIEDIKTRLVTCPKEELFCGYLDRLTMWEYFKFMDLKK